ncbi:MAG: DUF5676 family membrane protein [Betaproteobacteria bacterium]
MESDQQHRPLAVGVALAVTVGVMYLVCAALWLTWTEGALDFLNALFHGLDFRRLQAPGKEMSLASFGLPLLVLTAWGFIAGALYAAVHNWLER